jgi:hypothetical protein
MLKGLVGCLVVIFVVLDNANKAILIDRWLSRLFICTLDSRINVALRVLTIALFPGATFIKNIITFLKSFFLWLCVKIQIICF